MSTATDVLIDEMRGRAADLRALNARVRFSLGADGDIFLDATRNPVAITAAGGADADCTLRLSADNLSKLMRGKLNPMLAFSLGKLKVDGSKGVAMKLASLLDA